MLNHSCIFLQQDDKAATRQEVLPLDMAENSVDDQYLGCKENMRRLVEGKYLNQELKSSKNFSKVWETGKINSICNSKFVSEYNLTRNHCLALYVYTYDVVEPRIHRIFNNATYTGRANYTNMKYQWYSHHFLVTDAIQRLNKIEVTDTVTNADEHIAAPTKHMIEMLYTER